ncbi:PEP-CTERM sorting domain-containing protein, partial [Akkermansiaceae bacterium]|nr:PEP-CTERM sorting domain-containing protein [Akkermansiaceae bacterium]
TGFGFIAVFEFADADVPSTASLLKQNNTIGQLGLVSLDATNSPEDGAVFATIDNVIYVDINDLYIVIGDNSSIASATELALVQASGLVLQSGGGGADTLGTYDLDKSSDVSIGTVGTGIFDYTAFGQPNYSSNSLALSSVAAIPEPSSLALSGLALFALAGRRSRK